MKPILHQDILRHQNTLERLFNQADALDDLDGVDDEVKAHFTRYLCVSTSAFLELSLKRILREYVSAANTDPLVAKFVFHHLDRRSPGPRRDEILQLLGRFSDEWKSEVGIATRGQISGSLTSLVNDRNNIAHGETVNLSLNDLKNHFENAKKVVEIIHRHCHSNSMEH